MNIINLDKEKEIAIKAAKLAGKLLKEDKNILNLKINSNPRDTKLKADIPVKKTVVEDFFVINTGRINTSEVQFRSFVNIHSLELRMFALF